MPTIIRPTSDHLADVLVLNKLLDSVTDLYRHKKELIIEISFDEYINFVRFVLDNVQYFTLPSNRLKEMAAEYLSTRSNHAMNRLYKYYVLDVCLGAAKELSLAERRGKEATCIRYAPKGTPQVYFMNQIEEFDYDIDMEFNFYRRLALSGYALPESVSPVNASLQDFIKYSVRLAARSTEEVFLLGGINLTKGV